MHTCIAWDWCATLVCSSASVGIRELGAYMLCLYLSCWSSVIELTQEQSSGYFWYSIHRSDGWFFTLTEYVVVVFSRADFLSVGMYTVLCIHQKIAKCVMSIAKGTLCYWFSFRPCCLTTTNQTRQGFLTIVTDSLPYGKSLAATARAAGFVSKHGRNTTETIGGNPTSTPPPGQKDTATASASGKRRKTDVRSDAKGIHDNGHFIGRSIYDTAAVPTAGTNNSHHESADGESATLYALDGTGDDGGGVATDDEVGVWRDGAVALHAGTPGEECGHVVETSSYFDRMWTEGSKTKRYFLCVVADDSTVCISGVSSAPRAKIQERVGKALPQRGAENREKRKVKEVRI